MNTFEIVKVAAIYVLKMQTANFIIDASSLPATPLAAAYADEATKR